MANSEDPDEAAPSEAMRLLLQKQYDLGLHYLLRPVYPKT